MTWDFKKILSILLAVISQTVFGQTNKVKVAYPNIVGLTLKEAKVVLQKTKLELGAIIYESETKHFDSLIVYRQNPPTINDQGDTNYVKKSKLIDIWVSKPYNNLDTLNKPKKGVVIREVKVN